MRMALGVFFSCHFGGQVIAALGSALVCHWLTYFQVESESRHQNRHQHLFRRFRNLIKFPLTVSWLNRIQSFWHFPLNYSHKRSENPALMQTDMSDCFNSIQRQSHTNLQLICSTHKFKLRKLKLFPDLNIKLKYLLLRQTYKSHCERTKSIAFLQLDWIILFANPTRILSLTAQT